MSTLSPRIDSRVRVSAPCRLHFGLLRFRNPAGRSYGGLGMMLNQPRVILEVQQSAQWSATGPMGKRALEFAQISSSTLDKPAAFSVNVLEAPTAHTGLGVGTQLGLAVAAGVFVAAGLPCPPAPQLAQIIGRGRRSAIGTRGFDRGGLILENGYERDASLGELAGRSQVPAEWRFVLINLSAHVGISGDSEMTAFKDVPPVPAATTQSLWKLATEVVMPAAQHANFQQFAKGLYDYGRIAGECFAAVQGGPYGSPELESAVESLRSAGAAGVGQSSWGPTLYAAMPSEADANSLIDHLKADASFGNARLHSVAANNHGAEIVSV